MDGKGTEQACRQTESLVGISERSLRKWRKSYYARGEIAISKRAGSQKNPLLIDENLKEEVIEWLRKETSRKNNKLTVSAFCRWINNTLIPKSNMPANYPKEISRVTDWRWMYSLGFCYVKYTKGYVDGHEREDVVKDRNCLLYTSPSPRDRQKSRMPSSA